MLKTTVAPQILATCESDDDDFVQVVFKQNQYKAAGHLWDHARAEVQANDPHALVKDNRSITIPGSPLDPEAREYPVVYIRKDTAACDYVQALAVKHFHARTEEGNEAELTALLEQHGLTRHAGKGERAN